MGSASSDDLPPARFFKVLMQATEVHQILEHHAPGQERRTLLTHLLEKMLISLGKTGYLVLRVLSIEIRGQKRRNCCRSLAILGRKHCRMESVEQCKQIFICIRNKRVAKPARPREQDIGCTRFPSYRARGTGISGRFHQKTGNNFLASLWQRGT